METRRVEVVGASVSVGSRQRARTLWSGVDLRVDAGECVCITGPSGSGKSTLLNCIGLLERFATGTLRLNGRDATRLSERQRLRVRRHELGYLFQDYALIEGDSVEANVRLAAPTREAATRCTEALAAVGLDGRGRAPVYELSGGEQQRVALARLLVRRPSIVLADEPTASLDRDNAARILGSLRQLAEENGAAIVLVTHDPWVMDQCDRRKELVPHD